MDKSTKIYSKKIENKIQGWQVTPEFCKGLWNIFREISLVNPAAHMKYKKISRNYFFPPFSKLKGFKDLNEKPKSTEMIPHGIKK